MKRLEWMHVDPAQVPTDLKEPAMEAGQPPDADFPDDAS